MTERTIFLTAIEIADAAKRTAYLDEACGDDAELRSQVESLLSTHKDSSQFLETPPAAVNSAVEMTIVSHSPDDDDDDHKSAATSGAAELQKYLEPATRPGWLGRLAHYEIELILGRGAFGIVVKAFDEKLHRVVAIKLMNPDLASTSPPRKRFLREARTAAAVRHENIVGIHAVEEEPIPYLVMEYIPGITLQQRLDQNGPLELPEILKIGQQMAAGMAAAHAANLIHRDIKPSNILLEEGIEARVKISDFGLARAVDDASLTSSGLIAGTPMYMAPEQARGEILDHRADLFSLGSVLYQMTSGRPPFRAANTMAVLKRVCDDTPRPIQDVVPGVPDWLCSIVFRLLEKKADARFQTAKEVADLIARCQAELQLNGKVTAFPARILSEPNVDATANAVSELRAYSPTPLARNFSTRRTIIFVVIMLCVFIPPLFGRRIKDTINSWVWPAIPTLAVNEVNAGLSFDGADDRVEIAPVDWSFPQFTIEAFVTSNAGSDNGNIVTLTGGSGEKLELMGLYDDTQADPGARKSGAQIMGKSGFNNVVAPLVAGALQHRALVFDGNHMQYYVNGIWQGKRRSEAHAAMLWKFTELRIGSSSDNKKYFEGIIDQLRISKVARYLNNFAPVTSVSSDEQTLALYNFDEGRGDMLKDASGNGHDGKIIGATWIHSAGGGNQPFDPASKISNQKSKIENPIGWHGWPADAPAPAIAPFDAAQAKQHQEEWAAYLKLPVEYTNSLSMKFVLIPPGEFTMGSTAAEIEAALKDVGEEKHWQESIKSEAPQHKVILTQAIYLGVNEVTQKEYETVMKATPSHFASTGSGKDAVANLETQNHPVEAVSWNDAAEFCAKLSQKEELKPFYFRAGETITPLDGTGYRLPTEAEWEFACRAGTTTKYWIGDKDDELVPAGWFGGNSGGRTHAAGELKANPLGLYDIHGNVWEWVADAWEPTYYGQFEEKPAINPNTPNYDGSRRVLRGGVWYYAASYCRSSLRPADDPTRRDYSIGFRVSLVAEAVKESLKRPVAAAVAKTAWQGWPADAPAPATAPFDAAQAKTHQAAWAAYLNVPVEYTNSFGMQLVLIPPGEFTMGSPPAEIEAAMKGFDEVNLAWWKKLIESEAPQHTVILTQPFYLGTQEVTQKHYESVVGQNPSHFASTGAGAAVVAGLDTANYPVDSLSWVDAAEFCNKLCPSNESTPYYLRTGEAFTLLKGNGYRLPTEEEWEFACRAGTMTKFWSGDTDAELVRAGWFNVNSGGRTHAVGELARNPLGLFDIHGNVNEWVGYNWDPNSYARSGDSAAVDPAPPVDFSPISLRTIRGGSYLVEPLFSRSSARGGQGAADIVTTNGLRVALSVDAVKAERHRLALPDRELAEWAFQQGVLDMIVIPPSGEAVYVMRVEDLPQTPFHLFLLDVKVDYESINDATLEKIGRLSHLQTLIFRSEDATVPLTQVTDRGLQHLADGPLSEVLSCLQFGILTGPLYVSDATILSLNRMTKLQTLALGGDQLTNAGLEKLDLPNLKSLSLRGSQVTPVGINAVVAKTKGLSYLYVSCPKFTGPELNLVRQWQLNSLDVRATVTTDSDLQLLASCTSLQELWLNDTHEYTVEGLRHLAALPLLKTLSLHSATDSCASLFVTDLPSLESLFLGNAAMTDAGLKSLSSHPHLKSIYIQGVSLTDAGLEHLTALHTLEHLNVKECPGVTEAGVRKLQAALPKCKIVSDFPDVAALPKVEAPQ